MHVYISYRAVQKTAVSFRVYSENFSLSLYLSDTGTSLGMLSRILFTTRSKYCYSPFNFVTCVSVVVIPSVNQLDAEVGHLQI